MLVVNTNTTVVTINTCPLPLWSNVLECCRTCPGTDMFAPSSDALPCMGEGCSRGVVSPPAVSIETKQFHLVPLTTPPNFQISPGPEKLTSLKLSTEEDEKRSRF